jgi:hypothetical protein
MIETRWTRFAAWAAVLSVIAVIACAGVARAEDDEEEDSDPALWKSIKQQFGFGNSGGIEFRERSPLVVPPSRDLPPPERASADRKNALPPDLGVSRQSDIASRRLGGATARAAPPPGDEPDDPGASLKPKANNFSKMFNGGLFSSFNGGTKEIGTFKSEPPRTTLTEPPPGYQTPAPTAPYGITSGGRYDPPEEKDPGR